MRIDAHVHFWHYRAEEYPWIDDSMVPLRRDFQPADLEPALSMQGFDACIAVQARPTTAETRYLLELARSHACVAGVVGWIDLATHDLDLLDAPALVGVRHMVESEDDTFLSREDFRRGFARLRGHDVAYDLLIRPRQLDAVLDFVDAFEDRVFVLDHLGKPCIGWRVDGAWQHGFTRLAERPHVHCKVSGLVTQAAPAATACDFEPYLEAALEAFGPDRLIFGSDWPVCRLRATYQDVHDMIARWAAELSATERDRLFGGNAERVYRLDREHASGKMNA